MALRKQKTPTLADRMVSADLLRTSAIAQFDKAATDLEYAADEQADLAAEAFAEAELLVDLGNAANAASAANEKAARKIRALFS